MGLFSHWWQDPLSDRIRLALADAVRTHGPITSDAGRLNSAVKRVYGVLKALDLGQLDKERAKAREGGQR